ncbi:MAG: GNAT family N-acetyltransferase [Myxococcota bacterium]
MKSGVAKYTLVDEAPPAAVAAELYGVLGWTAYDAPRLARALAGSTFVTAAFDAQETLVGLARVISDDASVWFLQDLLVHPQHRRKGLARRLVARCRERFAHVGRAVLLTDAEGPRSFYAQLGFEEVGPRGLVALVDLSPPASKDATRET